jgi:hypothetical protein
LTVHDGAACAIGTAKNPAAPSAVADATAASTFRVVVVDMSTSFRAIVVGVHCADL